MGNGFILKYKNFIGTQTFSISNLLSKIFHLAGHYGRGFKNMCPNENLVSKENTDFKFCNDNNDLVF